MACNFDAVVIFHGIVPVIAFEVRFNDFKLEIPPKLAGIVPLMLSDAMYKYSKFVRLLTTDCNTLDATDSTTKIILFPYAEPPVHASYGDVEMHKAKNADQCCTDEDETVRLP